MKLLLIILLFFKANSQLQKVLLPTNSEPKIRSIYVGKTERFLWLGTDQGLYRYDGHSAKIFKKKENSISDNFIWDIKEDKQKNLYIGTESGGLNYFDKKTETFTFYKSDYTDNGPKHNSINSILIDTLKNGVWLGTYGGGLNFFDIKTKSFTHINFPEKFNLNKNSIYIRKLCWAEKKNRIWLATKNGAILFNTEKLKFEKIILPKTSILTVLQENNFLYMGTWGKGLIKYDLSVNKVIQNQKILSFNRKVKKVWTISKKNKDEIFICTIDEGLFEYNILTELYKKIGGSYPDDFWAIASSANQNRFFFGSSTGLYTNYLHIKREYSYKLKGINSSFEIHLKDDSTVYLGTNKGLRVFNFKQNKLQHEFYNSIGEELYSIYRDRKENWLFGKNNGLSIYNNSGLKVRFNEQSVFNGLTVNDIISDHNNNLLIGTQSGLYVLNSEYKVTQHFTQQDQLNKINGNIVNNLSIDNQNNIWVGTDSKGLNKIKYKEDRFVSESISFFKDKVITTTVYDLDSTLWVCAYGSGLSYKAKGTSNFKKTSIDEFKNSTFYNAVVDNIGRLWLTSIDGVIIYNNELRQYRLLKSSDLGIKFYYDHGILKDKSGIIYFLSGGDFIGLNPNDYKISQSSRNIIFTNFKLFNKEPEISESSPLKKSIIMTDEMTLRHDQNILTFNYSALEYLKNDQIVYKRKLEGFDKDWVQTKENSVTYTNLDPGEYSLKVKAALNPSLFTDHYKELKITVLPPIWMTWYAYTFYVAVLFLAYYLRIRAIQQKNRELERLVMQRTMELRELNENLEEMVEDKTRELQDTNLSLEDEIKVRKITEKKLEKRSRELRRLFNYVEQVREDERKNLSREVHDELGQILTALKMDTKWIEKKADANEVVIRKSGSMISLIDKAVGAVQRICSSLRPNILDELGLIAAIEWQLSDFKERSGIDFKLEIDDKEQFNLNANAAISLFRAFQETMTNVLRHANASLFSVFLKVEQHKLVLEMKDNGKGLEESQIKSSKSLGLLGMKERISEIGGRLLMNGVSGQGTTVRIELNKK